MKRRAARAFLSEYRLFFRIPVRICSRLAINKSYSGKKFIDIILSIFVFEEQYSERGEVYLYL